MVTNCSFESTSSCLRNDQYGCGRGTETNSTTGFITVLRNNHFRCAYRHVWLDWPYCNSPNEMSVTLQQNTFQQYELGYYYYYYSAAVELDLSNVLLVVTHNTFVNIRKNALSVDFRNAIDSDVVFSDNVFTAVQGDFVVLVHCPSQIHYQNISFTRNDFYFNSATTTVLTSCAGLFLTENVFVNPLAIHDYKVSVQYADTAMMFAPLNYWNATTFGEVAVRVFDHTDDESLAVVQVSPWYLDTNRTQTASGRHMFFTGPFEIGGQMESNVTLSSTEQPYRVTQNILVPYGYLLVIEAGVKLMFANGGITVKGEC